MKVRFIAFHWSNFKPKFLFFDQCDQYENVHIVTKSGHYDYNIGAAAAAYLLLVGPCVVVAEGEMQKRFFTTITRYCCWLHH